MTLILPAMMTWTLKQHKKVYHFLVLYVSRPGVSKVSLIAAWTAPLLQLQDEKKSSSFKKILKSFSYIIFVLTRKFTSKELLIKRSNPVILRHVPRNLRIWNFCELFYSNIKLWQATIDENFKIPQTQWYSLRNTEHWTDLFQAHQLCFVSF